VTPAVRALITPYYPDWPDWKVKKYPTERELKALGGYILEFPLTPPVENAFYYELLRLAKAVMNHKYGPGGRLDYDTLPHDIASSVMMTVVRNRKQVFSWTNLMKKVVKDNVSSYLGKVVYRESIVSSIEEMDQHGQEDGVNYGWEFNTCGVDTSVSPEDLLYMDELMVLAARSLVSVAESTRSLRHFMLYKLAVYELVRKIRHPVYKWLRGSDLVRYSYYVTILRIELSPVLNNRYLQIQSEEL